MVGEAEPHYPLTPSTHDDTMKQYGETASQNKNVRVLSFDSVTDPDQIASALLSIIGE